jgi:hypothetical protein
VTRSTHRRGAALLAGAAVAAGLLVSGCSAGQIAETAEKQASVPGTNADAEVHDASGAVIGRVSVRNVVVAYPGPEGYPAGGDAPLEVAIFNDTPKAVRVRVTSPTDVQPGEEGTVAARSVELTGSGAVPTGEPTTSPSATGSPTARPSGTATPTARPPATPTARPAAEAVIEIPASSFAILRPDTQRYLKLVGLNRSLLPGSSARLLFEFTFDDGARPLRITVPVTPPLSPEPRATPDTEEQGGGH